MFSPRRKFASAALVALSALACAASAIAQTTPANSPAARSTMHIPPDSAIPAGPLGDAVRLGRDAFTKTQTVAKAYIGNGLLCTSCHLAAGTQPYGGPVAGTWGVYPDYDARSGSVETLGDRINDCFERSMNGRRVPLDSELMRGLLAYIWWLSAGVPTGESVVGRGFEHLAPAASTPDATRGKAGFAAKCAACHGADGQGLRGAGGVYVFPPLWGPDSFNAGAGMARLGTAASFVQTKMPLGAAGSLSPQEAWDIAAFFTSQPRPDFAAKGNDWKGGGKPRDVAY